MSPSRLAREVRIMDPPAKWTVSRSCESRSTEWVARSNLSPKSLFRPSYRPVTRMPLLAASMAAALMTLLIPGAGPPPTSIARCLSAIMRDYTRARPSRV